MADLMPVFLQMRDDDDLAERFTENPEAVLTELGIDPSEVTITQLPGGNAPYENFKQVVDTLATQEKAASPGSAICMSLGVGLCVSAGS
jgi:hypothetical protein